MFVTGADGTVTYVGPLHMGPESHVQRVAAPVQAPVRECLVWKIEVLLAQRACKEMNLVLFDSGISGVPV